MKKNMNRIAYAATNMFFICLLVAGITEFTKEFMLNAETMDAMIAFSFIGALILLVSGITLNRNTKTKVLPHDSDSR